MPAPGASRATALCLLLILGVYFGVGAQYAALTPPWQVPDEPAHFNYIRHIAATSALPVLQDGDYNQQYLSQLTAEGFPPDKPVESLRYEGHQPPLYYLLATPVFLASGGGLLPLRLFSLTLGAGVVVFAFLTARALFDSPALALTAAGLVAFVPQHVAMMAGVNNDSLAELVIGATLWAALRAPAQGAQSTRASSRPRLAPGVLSLEAWDLGFGIWDLRLDAPWLFVGLLVGAAFVTKATAYVVAPVVALALWQQARREGWPPARLARCLAIAFVPALVIGAIWWGRNLGVYGWPDVLGLGKHDAIITGQPRTQEWIAAYGPAAFLLRFAVTTFRSFWGQFGWMGVVMDARVYWALLAFSLFVVLGCLLAIRRGGRWAQSQRDGLALLSFSGLLTVALYAYYNLALVQHQGRYLFPALIPLAVWAALGLHAWAQRADGKWQMADGKPRRLHPGQVWQAAGSKVLAVGDQPSAIGHQPPAISQWLPLGAVGLLAALDLVALYRFILPGLPRF